MDKSQPTTLIAACKDFFGFLPGQSLMEFRAEYMKLTDADREEIKTGLEANGYIFSK